MQFLDNIFQTIRAELLPTACIACPSFQSKAICNSCLNTLECNSLIHYECCYQCGIPLNHHEAHDQRCTNCKVHSPFFDETWFLDCYDGILRDALHQLKYQTYCLSIWSCRNMESYSIPTNELLLPCLPTACSLKRLKVTCSRI